MAKDDYYVIAYRILAYLYVCLKKGEKPNLEYLKCETEDFPVGKDYWNYILSHLYMDGYLEGISLIPILGKEVRQVRMTNSVMITPEGIAYLQENSAMQKAKNFLKEIKEMLPEL